MKPPRRYLIANWKMNLPPEGLEAYGAALSRPAGDQVEIVLAPPFPFIAALAGAGFSVAAQNCSHEISGAFTGEVSAAMLRENGASYAIVGHSERRQMFGESNTMVGRKAAACAIAGLTPIICIGEEWSVRDDHETEDFLATQIHGAWSDELAAASSAIIAYEPVWAIGSGRNATAAVIAETVSMIRRAISRRWKNLPPEAVPILYGGSVTPENVAELWLEGAIDGFLVGGASLDSGRVRQMAEAMAAEPQERSRRS